MKRLLILSLAATAAVLIAGKAAGQRAPSGGAAFRIQSPLPDERFVGGESVALRTAGPGASLDARPLRWTSSRDGDLGTGSSILVRRLSPGRHVITVAGGGASQTVAIRVFEDLWEFYKAPQARAEVERIARDFSFAWIDGRTDDERWTTYEKTGFDPSSPEPSKAVVYAKLDVLRHQQFAEPLPFTRGKSIYDHLRTHVRKLVLGLGCAVNTGGGGTINLSRNFCVWDLRASGAADRPDACKVAPAHPQAAPYIHSLYLLVHEGRHSEPGEPGHVECQGKGNMDPSLENGSGHAAAALYLMWVYKYGLYDPPAVKAEAGTISRSLLKSRFCAPPAHSDPKVQALLDELLK